MEQIMDNFILLHSESSTIMCTDNWKHELSTLTIGQPILLYSESSITMWTDPIDNCKNGLSTLL